MMRAGTQERRKIMGSARKELFDALWDNCTEGEKNRLIDDFARELEERIRREADGYRGRTASTAAQVCSDLITATAVKR